MAKPGEKRDPHWEVTAALSGRLLASALNLFAREKCYGPDAVLPGTGKCAEDLVADAIVSLICGGYWTPESTVEQLLPLALTILRHDFLDLVKSPKYKSLESREPTEMEQERGKIGLYDYQNIEANLRLNSFRRVLANDAPALTLLELKLLGWKTSEIARKMQRTEKEVRNINKRLTYKIDKLEKLPWPKKDR